MTYALFVRLGVLASLGGSAALWGRHEAERLLPAAEVLPGLHVDGARVEGPLRAFVAARAEAMRARTLHVKTDRGDDLGTHTLAELGLSVDEEASVARALRVGHEGDLLQRVHTTERAAAGAIDVPLATAQEAAPLVALVSKHKEALDMPPASARLDLEHHAVLPEQPGRYLDAFGAIARLDQAAHDPSVSELTVAFTAVPPRVTTDFVRNLDVSTVLGSFDTWFSRTGDQKRRGENIDNAARKLDGVVLMPGEIASFNAIVGDRSEENGFQRSWEIYKGEMVEGVGGGTCQVASTLHAAAFFGGLDILERLPHSRPSAYIPMGLDATVVYPIVDLKLRNPHPFPVVVHAKTDGAKLTIQLLGATRPVKVSFARELLDTKPWPRKVEEDPRLSGNTVIVKQHGIRGYRIQRERVVTSGTGERKVETNVDIYPPTTEIYAVPPGFDETKLPPLPSPETTDAVVTDPTTDLTFQEAPGAHAPTHAQKEPEKSVRMAF